MRKITLLLALVATLSAVAQEKRFVIDGEMRCDSLRFEPRTVKTLYLVHDVDGQQIVVDTAQVVDKKFRFEGVVPEVPEIYNITGFDNGAMQVFIEEGTICIAPFDACFPASARIGGTPCNEILQAYYDANDSSINEGKIRMREALDALPDTVKNNPQEMQKIQGSIFYMNNLYTKTAIMDFVSKHLDSPVSLYIIKYSMFPLFTPQEVERLFLNAIPAHLHSYAAYKELVNKVRAAQLKIGALAPDISGFTTDHREITLSDLKGKYVLLDFWASWCAPCRREFPFIKEALAYSEKSDNFVVLSYSLDNNEKNWVDCIGNNSLEHKNWIHISTLKGWNSEAAKLFNVEGVPYTALIDPEGKVLAFELRGEAMVKRVKRIVDGAEKK